MKDAPIPVVLDLWSLGHSAADIAAKLGFPSFRHVARIIAHARRLGDSRAVLHCYPCGRAVGNLRKAIRVLAERPQLETVSLLPFKPKKRGPRGPYKKKSA